MFYPGKMKVKFFYGLYLDGIETEVQDYLDENKIKKDELVKFYLGGTPLNDRIVYHCCVVHE